MASKKVAFVTEDSVVHELLGEYKDMNGNVQYDLAANVKLPGESVALENLPPYLRKRVEAGEVSTLVVMTEAEAEAAKAEVLRVRALYEAAQGNALAVENLQQSHSDWLVPDAVRAAQLAAQGRAESGEPGPEE